MPVKDVQSALLHAQHCFIRAVQLQREPSALANLALLFLMLGMNDATRQSYSALQFVEHHPIMGIGVGMLWERNTELPADQREKVAGALQFWFCVPRSHFTPFFFCF